MKIKVMDIIETLIKTLVPSIIISVIVYTALVILTNVGDIRVEQHHSGWTYEWMENSHVLIGMGLVCWVAFFILMLMDKIYKD